MKDVDELAEYVRDRLSQLADPEKAGQMAAYMKTDMPFYGVQRPGRMKVEREVKRRFRPSSFEEYASGVLALWTLPHREGKYLALAIAFQHPDMMMPDAMPLFERLIREGAWWDLVDFTATHLVGSVLLNHPGDVWPVLDRWIEDADVWIRRTAILAQNRHKQRTNESRLYDYCLCCAGEKEFFIRKAIGWALREYSKSAPESVRDFLLAHREDLSGLSFREGAKHLVRTGVELE